MKSRKERPKEVLKQLTAQEKQDALKWIESLSTKQLTKLEQITRLQVAQALMEAYLKRVSSKRRKSHKKGKK